MRALCTACALAPTLALAQDSGIVGVDVQKLANGVLALMGFTVTPDVTTGSLSIFNQETGNPDFKQGSVGGGFTISKNLPLYLEGTAAYARYDPTFFLGTPEVEQAVQVTWESVSLSGGIGWDFPLAAAGWTLRPIFNISLGRVTSSGADGGGFLATRSGAEPEFLQGGELNAFGLGGSLMLDYERYRPENEIDLELRYSNIYLQSFDSSAAVEGQASAQSVSLWSRWRAPTGINLLERPLRYVLEYAYTRFLGDLEGVLGFDDIHSFGVGLELDSTKYDVIVDRTRLLVRYKIGNNVTGWAVGLAVSF
ncbi:MAG TPA: autotransporter domain-containing protein [Burkholderiales bacterium]|nr:autotransporter domain-containing protein [Burkholderiales bacterium]